MKTLEDIFAFAKRKLAGEINNVSYQSFLDEVTKALKNVIHENYSAKEVLKVSILVNLLKRKAETLGIQHKLETLLDVLETSTVVINEENHENQPISTLLLEMKTLEEKKLKQHFEINFL